MRLYLERSLDESVARLIVDSVGHLASQVRDVAAVRAPDGKQWLTMDDDRVRPTHRETHGQLCPANVPFILPRPGGGQDETANAPRDPNLSAANSIQCRCIALVIPQAVARSLRVSDATVLGTTVTASVYTDFPRAGESEMARDGGGWLLGAAQDVARGSAAA